MPAGNRAPDFGRPHPVRSPSRRPCPISSASMAAATTPRTAAPAVPRASARQR
jgi:hypothetical protein